MKLPRAITFSGNFRTQLMTSELLSQSRWISSIKLNSNCYKRKLIMRRSPQKHTYQIIKRYGPILSYTWQVRFFVFQLSYQNKFHITSRHCLLLPAFYRTFYFSSLAFSAPAEYYVPEGDTACEVLFQGVRPSPGPSPSICLVRQLGRCCTRITPSWCK